MLQNEFILVNRTTNVVLFRGDMAMFRKFYVNHWMSTLCTGFVESYIESYAEIMNCDIYHKVEQ